MKLCAAPAVVIVVAAPSKGSVELNFHTYILCAGPYDEMMCCKRLLYDVAMSVAFHNIMMLLLFLMNFRWRSFSNVSVVSVLSHVSYAHSFNVYAICHTYKRVDHKIFSPPIWCVK